MKPFIVEVHVRINPSLTPRVKEEIENVLRKENSLEFRLRPLYFTGDKDHNEIRVCFAFEDPEKLEAFITEKIRSVRGVEATRVRLTLKGEIFPKGLSILAEAPGGEAAGEYKSCHIFINVEPGKDMAVWQRLKGLGEKRGVSPVWIFRDYYEYDRDVTLRLVGKGADAIISYIATEVEVLEGVGLLNYRFMDYMVPVANKEELIELAKNWVS